MYEEEGEVVRCVCMYLFVYFYRIPRAQQMLHCDDILNGFKNEKKEEGRGSDDEEEGGESKLEEEIIDENYYHGGIVPLFCRKAKGEAAISSQPWITPRALPICKLLIEDTWKTASDVLDIRGSIWALGFQTGAWIIVGHIGGLPPNGMHACVVQQHVPIRE